MDNVLKNCEGYVVYEPLPDEPDWRTWETLDVVYTIPQNRTFDPYACAEELKSLYGDKKLAVLVPGTKFDVYGTRHGRGGGWYDRFLSRLPNTWIRVGLAQSSRITEEQLPRQPWDVPMHALLIKTDSMWELKKV